MRHNIKTTYLLLRGFAFHWLFHTGMYLQPLPDYTVRIGDEAGRPDGGEEALGGKEMREDF